MLDIKKRFIELMRISSPIIMEQIFITVMGLVNQMMAANAIGEHAVSAVGIIDGVSNIMIAVFAALTTGGTIVVARHAGRRDLKGAKQSGAQAVTLAVIMSAVILLLFGLFRVQIIGFLFGASEESVYTAGLNYFTVIIFSFPMLAIMQTIFGIVRGVGDTATPMKITIIMNVINVMAGFLFIFPWEFSFFGLFGFSSSGFGVYGAALALTTARFVGMLLAVLFVLFKSRFMRLNNIADFKPDFNVQKEILGIGVPASVESSMFQVGRMITQLYIVGMGTASLFANSVTNNIFNFINVPGNAFGIGVMILVGNKVGRGEYEDIKKSTLFATFTGAAIFAVLCILLFPMIGVIINAFNAGEESAPIIRNILISGIITTPIFWSPAFVLPAGLRAVGDVKYTMIWAIFTMWTIRIGLGYVFGVMLDMGVIGVWFAMYTDWVIRSLIFTVRLLRGKWMKNLPALD